MEQLNRVEAQGLIESSSKKVVKKGKKKVAQPKPGSDTQVQYAQQLKK